VNEVRSDLREQKIERARFFVRRVVRARYGLCARRVCAVWRELRSPARGVRTNGALVPYLSCFLVFLGASDGVGKEPAASAWRRKGAAMASVDRCVFATAVADYQTLTKSGRSHSPTHKNNPDKKKRFFIRARMPSICVRS